jgi:hypothetical protein
MRRDRARSVVGLRRREKICGSNDTHRQARQSAESPGANLALQKPQLSSRLETFCLGCPKVPPLRCAPGPGLGRCGTRITQTLPPVADADADVPNPKRSISLLASWWPNDTAETFFDATILDQAVWQRGLSQTQTR